MRPVVWMTLLAEGILILLAWGGGVLFKISPWQTVAFTPQAVLWGALGALPLLGGMAWSTRTQWRVFVQLRRQVQARVIPLFAGCSALEMALIAIFAGVGEELFFRGLVQTGLTSATSLWIGLGVTSALFGVLHYISLTYAVLAGLIGLYLGVLFVVVGNLAGPVITHALYDFVALVYLVRLLSGTISGDDRIEFGEE